MPIDTNIFLWNGSVQGLETFNFHVVTSIYLSPFERKRFSMERGEITFETFIVPDWNKAIFLWNKSLNIL